MKGAVKPKLCRSGGEHCAERKHWIDTGLGSCCPSPMAVQVKLKVLSLSDTFKVVFFQSSMDNIAVFKCLNHTIVTLFICIKS